MSTTTTERVEREQSAYQLPREVIDRIAFEAFRRRTNRSRVVEELVLKNLPPVPVDVDGDDTGRAAG